MITDCNDSAFKSQHLLGLAPQIFKAVLYSELCLFSAIKSAGYEHFSQMHLVRRSNLDVLIRDNPVSYDGIDLNQTINSCMKIDQFSLRNGLTFCCAMHKNVVDRLVLAV
jgi:hypothetical protein